MQDTETFLVSDDEDAPGGAGAQARFCNIISIIPIIFYLFLIAGQTSVDNKTPHFLSIACPEFAELCEMVKGNGLLDLCKRLLFLAADDFLIHGHWTCFDYEHNRKNWGKLGIIEGKIRNNQRNNQLN